MLVQYRSGRHGLQGRPGATHEMVLWISPLPGAGSVSPKELLQRQPGSGLVEDRMLAANGEIVWIGPL
jgi:hypothetical protein